MRSSGNASPLAKWKSRSVKSPSTGVGYSAVCAVSAHTSTAHAASRGATIGVFLAISRKPTHARDSLKMHFLLTRRLLWIASVASLAALPAVVCAQEDAQTLDKVTVVAQREATYRSDAASVGPLGDRPLLD